MKTVGDILTRFNPLEDKYISREFQSYGVHLSEELKDFKHKSLYIKLAKTLPRALLEKALSYVADAKVKRKGALFMWKLKELGAWQQDPKVNTVKRKKKAGRRGYTVLIDNSSAMIREENEKKDFQKKKDYLQ